MDVSTPAAPTLVPNPYYEKYYIQHQLLTTNAATGIRHFVDASGALLPKGAPIPVFDLNEQWSTNETYGKGRVFHTTLGHVGPKDLPPYLPLTCAGFIATVQRGTEWAATGHVTQPVPADFPTAAKTSLRTP